MMMAAVALMNMALLELTAVGIPAIAGRLSTWPAESIQCRTALLIVAISLEKFMQTYTFLEWNEILCHVGILGVFKQF